jgi:Transglycosylase SLT domain
VRCLLPLLLLFAVAAGPSPPPPLCDAAISGAETEARLPPRMMSAIAEVESGRLDAKGALHPWPWTINAEGQGQFFATKAAAIAAVRALQAKGVRSIDVGCMQVNLMHHPHAFASLDEAFDPSSNAAYAARFLNSLYAASGSWLQAVAAYHSETPAIGAAYQRLVMARWQGREWAGWQPLSVAYRDFAPKAHAYGDFAPTDSVYGAFAARPAQNIGHLAQR